MSSFLSELGGVTGGAGGEALAFAVGFAAGRALTPAGTTIEQDAWNGAQVRRLDAGTAAAAAAEGLTVGDGAASEATYSGYEASRFDVLYNLALTAPGMGELLTQIRRGTISDAQALHALRKMHLEPQYDKATLDLATVYLTPQQVALGIVRSVVRDPGLLPVQLDISDSNVARYPVYPGDPVAEAAAGGVDIDRLRVMVGEIGLPMSTHEAASAYFRKIITKGAYYQSILEGDVRPEWADAILAQAREILPSHAYAEGELRGYLTTAQRLAKTEQHGMSKGDSDLQFDLLGRPLNVHEITTALARGGTFGGDYSDIPQPYQDAIRKSAIRPEYAHLAYANRYTYPSAFVLRALAQAGELGTADEVAAALEDIGWRPDFAAKVAKAWAPVGTVADPHVAKAQTQLWNTVHKSFLAEEIDAAKARETLPKAGVDPAALDAIIATWDAERSLIRASLTAAQVKKAIGQPGKDHTWAMQRLRELGYDDADAETFLAE